MSPAPSRHPSTAPRSSRIIPGRRPRVGIAVPVHDGLSWTVEVHGGVEGLEEAWRSFAGPHNSTPFQNHDLMRLFYRWSGAEPVVAVARHPGGAVAAIFPMLRERRHGLRWLRTDARPLDYCAPILDPALTPQQALGLARAVLAAVPRADILYCNRMPAAFAGAPNPLAAVANAGRLRLSAWALPLSDGGKARRVRFRASVRARIRRLAEAHHRVVAIASGRDIAPADMAAFRRLRAETLPRRGRSDILAEPRWAGFYDGLTSGEAGGCVPWLATLKVDGEFVAGLYGFVEGSRVEALLAASRLDRWGQWWPGLQLFEEAVAHFGQRGAALFDFSIGDMEYKRRFGCEQVALHDAMFARGAAGRLYYLLWRLKVKIRDKLR